MAKGRKTGGRNFTGKDDPRSNNKGTPKLSEEQKRLRKLTQIEFLEAASKLIYMTVQELEEVAKDKQSNVLEASLAKYLMKGLTDHSHTPINYFVERFLGKVPEAHTFNGNLNTGLVDIFEKLATARKGGAIAAPQIEHDEDENEE